MKGIAFTESTYAAQREWKTFAATDGSFIEQTITHVGSAVEANAIDGDEHQRRSFPDSGGGWQAAGYEYIRSLDSQVPCRAAGRRGGGAPDRAAMPGRADHDRPRPIAALPPGP